MPRVLTLKKIEGDKPGEVYLQIKEVPKPVPGPNELLVRIEAAALNHRDLFIRRHQYPGISFDHAMLADGASVVVEQGESVTRRDPLHKRVVLTPMRGWESDPLGPEPENTLIIGASRATDLGTAQDFVLVDEKEVELIPNHLSFSEAAALPLGGATAWRALVTKANCSSPEKNVLITGVGGGVALQALQFAVAFGCNVYVTSGEQAKIDAAKKLGTRDGVLYKHASWAADLRAKLPGERPYLDAVIDGAGGDILPQTMKLLRPGGIIAQYGMTVSPKMDWLMQAVMANIELRGLSMGSRREFREMMKFVAAKRLKPLISKMVKGLGNLPAIDSLFEEMAAGRQFGKLVIEIQGEGESPRL